MSTTHESLDFTGERMVPEKADADVFWEHVYRYRFACPHVRNKRVLDIACGEGYGSAALLNSGARSIIGVDISQEACDHARKKYGIDARVGSAEEIPLPDQSVDVIVSFETIEHVPNPKKFLDECLRVLVTDGKLIISTPDKNIYKIVGEQNNPFHCSELTEAEFTAILRERFAHCQLFTQHPRSAPYWSPRSFSLRNTSWARLRVFGRLRRMLDAALNPEVQAAPDLKARFAVVEKIQDYDKPFSGWLNPYKVKKKLFQGAEHATYLIAIADKR